MTDMELLAPAGNAQGLHAAVQSGADAVYIGGPKFNARQSADNFSVEDIRKYTEYCHIYGVDVHTALNVLFKEKELTALVDYVYELNDAGVDALIIQDLGAAEIIKKAVPDMTLHASTQMTVTSLDGVKYLEDMGFSRVVLARELSEREIEYICKGAKAEIEVFVHGAICMCYSGQCLMSSIIGGRSGNRGRCAQPCRLPYSLIQNGRTVTSGNLLSPKDMALINKLQTLRNIGVSSLKIEGRLKSAEYVSAVVGIYRKYLDDTKPVTNADMQELTNAFSRSGFTDGYFTERLGGGMMSRAQQSEAKTTSFSESAIKRADINLYTRKIPVTISGTLKLNNAFEVAMRANNAKRGDTKCGFAKGILKAETAINKPLDKERLAAQLQKLGDTPFTTADITLELDEGVTIPIKEINSVRREAAAKLSARLGERQIGRKIKTEPDTRKRGDTKMELTAEVNNMSQAKAAVENGIKTIYAPKNIAGDIKTMFDSVNVVTKTSEIFCGGNAETDGVLVSSPAAVRYFSKNEVYGDFRLNVFNSQTANHFRGLKSVTLSPELNLGEIKALAENTDAHIEIIGYGRIPLMIMKNCPIKAAGKCQGHKTVYKLRDRKNEEFPLVCNDDCTVKILNSKPIYMADKIGDIKKLKINALRLVFTTESGIDCGEIIRLYKSSVNGDGAAVPAENTFTRGHYYRGVE